MSAAIDLVDRVFTHADTAVVLVAPVVVATKEELVVVVGAVTGTAAVAGRELTVAETAQKATTSGWAAGWNGASGEPVETAAMVNDAAKSPVSNGRAPASIAEASSSLEFLSALVFCELIDGALVDMLMNSSLRCPPVADLVAHSRQNTASGDV
jgi:hypothetical protein